MEELNVGGIISNGISRGIKNAAAIIVNFLLWLITIWIPYLNVGTTICIMAGLAAKSSRGEDISFTEIFNPSYRKNMGNYFLVSGFMFSGIGVAALFLFAPAIVLGIAWSMAPLLVVDKEMNPIEAINKSNQLTYGKKGTIFLASLVMAFIISIALGIVGYIFSLINIYLMLIIMVILMAFVMSIMISVQGYIYSALSKDMK